MLMENFLRSKEYWTIVESGVPEPTVGANVAQRAKIEKEKLKDLKAKNYLFQAIDCVILETILNKSTSKTIWDSMKKKYQGNERAKRQQRQALQAEFESQGKENWKGRSKFVKLRPGKLEESLAPGNQKRWQNRNYQVVDNKTQSVGKANIECFRCHKYGHYHSECCANLNRGKSSNFAKHNEKNDDSSLFMVYHPKEVSKKNVWYLDTSCSNHMCGDKFAFSDLDESCQDKGKFGDNSTIAVKGRGKVTIRAKDNSIQTIANVLYVPDLKSNLLSLGQLQEKGYEILIKDGVCQQKKMINGLPHFDSPSEICEISVVNKQHRDGFPKDRSWRTKSPTSPLPDMTPEKAWSGCGPVVDYFRIFGCIAYARQIRKGILANFENGENLTMKNSKGQTQQTEGLTSTDLKVSRQIVEESLPAAAELSIGGSLPSTPKLEFGTSS
ncbi:hypothetical protein SLEP1_g18127 [Rubroshorea leprosula]|uniref:CCHC-type domain-containing protein n=1 Tax=Rubroshorea leprosula TaxID=152421 RepID=A0AAV5J039_9ROSI|nr:hypothetical protein SLEP1_g18127 [Rubroshorea leprosula]